MTLQRSMGLHKMILQMTQPNAAGKHIRQDLDAYLAGFFDGEGHISIRMETRNRWSCYVEIGATNTDKRPLQMLKKAYGGRIVEKLQQLTSRKRCFAWRLTTGRDVLWALYRMLPWLTIKNSKARAAIIILRHRPLICAGGQTSHYQRVAITKALKGLHIIKINSR